MMSKKWQCKLLSVVLCASLIAPNLTVSAYAAETGQILSDGGVLTEFSEENVASDETEDVTESSTENTENGQGSSGEAETQEEISEEKQESGTQAETDTEEPAEEQESTETEETESEDGVSQEEETKDAPEEDTGADTELDLQTSEAQWGTFSNVSIASQGFHVTATGTFTPDAAAAEGGNVYLVQYAEDGTKLFSSNAGQVNNGSELNIDAVSLVHEDTAYFRLEAKNHNQELEIACSEDVQRSNPPTVTFAVDDVIEGATLGFEVSYTGDMQYDAQAAEEFLVELHMGKTADSSAWDKNESGSVAYFWETVTTPMIVHFTGIEPAEYYGKLVFYREEFDYETDAHVRLFEQEILLEEPFRVTEDFGSFEDEEITFQGMKLNVTAKFNHTGYQQDEVVTVCLVQYDEQGEEVYCYSFATYNGIEARTYEIERTGLWCHMDATTVRLEARGKDKVICSDEFTKTKPEINFNVTETALFKDQSVQFTISYAGNIFEDGSMGEYFKVAFQGSASENEDEWIELGEKEIYFDAQRTDNYISFEGFEPETTYYGELTVYKEEHNYVTDTSVRVIEKKIPVSFTTEAEEVVYDLEEVFPDEVLRNMIIQQIQYQPGYSAEDGTATESALAVVTSLYSSRYDHKKDAVKDLTGVDLLTGIRDVELSNHEITDVSEIDWSKLTKLETLNLYANDIAKFPDLSKNTSLTNVSLGGNRLSQEELAKAAEKLPVGFILDEYTWIDQRVNGFEIVAEDEYYYYGSTVNLYVQAKGQKTSLPYAVKFYVDNVEQTFESLGSSGNLYVLRNANLAEGTHTLKTELHKIYRDEQFTETTELEKTITHTFTVARQDVFGGKDPYYAGSDSRITDYMEVEIYYPTGMELTGAKMVKNGTVYAETDENSSLYTNSVYGDPRYHNLSHLSDMNMESNLYSTDVRLTFRYNTFPEGSYDLELTFAGGSVQTLKDAITVSGNSENIIIDCGLGYDFDQTGKYLYVALEGWNLNPAKLTYTIRQENKVYPVTYVNHRPTYSGAVVKLEKDGWTALENRSVQILIQGEGQQTEFIGYGYMETGIYYLEYNKITGKIEVAFTTDTGSNGKTVSVAVRSDYEGEVIAQGSAVVSDGIGYFEIEYNDGTAFPAAPGYYYMDFMVNSQIYSDESIYIDENTFGTYSTNYWSGDSAIYEGTDSPVMWYYSDMEYNQENAEVSSYTAQITGETLASPIVITSFENKVKTDKVHDMVAIGMEFDESSLKAGTYKITLFRGAKEVSARELIVKNTEKFILGYASASWDNESEIEVYLSTPNTANTDNYTVTLTDREGNKVSGLTTKVTDRYSSGVYLSVTGLEYKDARKQYYLKVTHNTLGEPYDYSGNLYYTDENGEFDSIGYSIFDSYVLNLQNRIIGIGMEKAALPVTLRVYKPYQTEPIYEVIAEQSKVGKDGSYLLPQDLYNSLPDKDGLYDIVCIDAKKRVGGFEDRHIGDYSSLVDMWNYTIDKTGLYINDEENKTATIEVVYNKEAPTFKSSDTGVVTVKADEENPNKAVITAVGIGRAIITISADGFTRSFPISVERKVTLERLELNKSEITLGVGGSGKLTAAVYPAEAWNEGLTFDFTVENAEGTQGEVIRIAQEDNADTATITAVGTGTATVTAVVTDPEKDVEQSAQCTVTVKNVYSEEEQRALAAAAGTRYVLLNTYPKMKATLADIPLSEPEAAYGWKWVDDSVALTADDTAPIQYYTAEYQTEDYEPFTAVLPVAVSQLTKVSVDGDKTIVTKETKEYQAVCQYKGYQPVADEFAEALVYRWTAAGTTPSVAIAQETAAAKTASITANEVTKNTSQTVNLVVAVGEKEFKASLKMTVTTEPYVDDITVSVAESQEETAIDKYEYNVDTLTVDRSVISTVKNDVHNTLRLEAAALVRGEKVTLAKGFKWSSSDTSVMTVKAEKGNTSAVLTFKKAGSALLHAVAQDGGKYDKEILVTIKDYTPILESNKIALDLYTVGGVAIPLKEQNGNTITDVGILEQDPDTKEWDLSNKFTVVEAENAEGMFCLQAKEGYEPTQNATVKVQLKVTTSRNVDVEGAETVIPATISVNVKTKPSASVKAVTKANLFETGAKANYKITSKYEIESIEDITVAENGSNRGRNTDETGFRLSLEDGDNGKVTLNAVNGEFLLDTGNTLSSETLAGFKEKNSALCQVKLRVNFKGYKDAADQEITITVATEDKKPSLKLNDIMLLSGMTETTTQVYDSKAKAIYPVMKSDVTISSKTENVTTEVTDDGMVKVAYSGTKDVKYKAEMTSAHWTQPLTLNGKISVSTPQKQGMVLDSTKIILNKEHNSQKNGSVAIGVSVKNNSEKIEKVRYHVDKKNAQLFNEGYLSITYSQKEQMLYVGLNDVEEAVKAGIKAGSYKVDLTGTVMVNGTEQSLKATTLTITLADKAPTVSLKAKGSIDLVRRQSTSIVYTPSYKNVSAVAESVTLSGAYAEYFKAAVEDGRVIVTAAEDQAMSTKISYPVTMILTLDNGCEVSSVVKIKPVNKLPKLTAKTTKATLYKANPEDIGFGVVTNDLTTSIDRIERVEDKNSKYFIFETEGDTITTVSLSDQASKMKPGKYTVSYKVYMEGAAYNVKPTTLKLTVTVK